MNIENNVATNLLSGEAISSCFGTKKFKKARPDQGGLEPYKDQVQQFAQTVQAQQASRAKN
eukprot:4440582-Lingulodinium_polyedra.AAC.1